MGALPLKQARMEFKTTDEVKNLLSEAAILAGLDLTAFVLNSATEKARAVLAEHSTVKLSGENHARFLQVLASPPRPSKALRKLMNSPRLPVR